MKKAFIVLAMLAATVSTATITACTSTPTQESTGEYIDDSVISNKIRAQLIGNKDLNVFKIDVSTFKGVVQLSGFVDSAAAKAHAERVARSTKGVKGVRNDLVIKAAET